MFCVEFFIEITAKIEATSTRSQVYQFNNITELFHKKKDALALPKPGWDYQRCSGTKKKESVAFPKIKRLQGGQRKLLEFTL